MPLAGRGILLRALFFDTIMKQIPYERPEIEVITLPCQPLSILVSFSAEGGFEDFEEGGEL